MATSNDTSEVIEIKLPTGEIALIDAIDADLGQLRWTRLKRRDSKRIYAQRTATVTQGRYLHRIILSRILGRVLGRRELVDHINRNGLDNRRENLRLASSLQNRRNSGIKQSSRLKYKGIVFIRANNCYEARICANYKTFHLGCYDTQLEAAIAYNHAAKKYHGEFAGINEIDNWEDIQPMPRQKKRANAKI